MNRFPKVLILSVLVALVILPQSGDTCGPFYRTPTFVRPNGPDGPMADFARGKIGVVLPDWYPAYRVVAYRYLESKPLSAAEQQSLQERFNLDQRTPPPDQTEKAIAEWTSARGNYNPPPAAIGMTNYKTSDSEFNSYPNCLAPAFFTAAATLKDRASRYGAASPELQEWIEGQDAVFANCSHNANLPSELPATANSLLRADRAYQIAAAHFYAGTPADYDAALQGFQAIAADKSSSWHATAAYLVARTLIRRASVTADPDRTYNPALLAKAETQLNAILNDPELACVHDDAESLLGLVNYHLYPDQREAELGKLIAAGDTGSHFGQYVVDYTWLTHHSPDPADLSEWLAQGGTPEGAVAKWKATHSVPWLVAVLWHLKPEDPAFNDVMAAAAQVPPTSEGYPTVAYYRARLARLSGDEELARQVLKAALEQSKTLPLSSIHLFQDEQMRAVTNFDSFEAVLWQNPVEYDDGFATDPCKGTECEPQFGPVAVMLLNTRIPVDVYARIAQSSALPANLRKLLAPTAWARAAMLEQPALANQVAEAAGSAQPALKPYLQQYAQAKTAEERQFAAAFAILHFPGLAPVVLWRLPALGELDEYRNNWWRDDVGSEFNGAPDSPKVDVGFPAFLNADERKRAAAERDRLHTLGSASHYLPRTAIDWGKKHPHDARVAESLHLAIRAMRYGDSNALSHEAYDLLHQNYPKSEWAKRTPVWFK